MTQSKEDAISRIVAELFEKDVKNKMGELNDHHFTTPEPISCKWCGSKQIKNTEYWEANRSIFVYPVNVSLSITIIRSANAQPLSR